MRKLLFILFLICPFFLNAQVLNEDDLGFYREDQLYFGFSFISLDANNKYFKQVGLSKQKILYINNISSFFLENKKFIKR